jgi:hypothetical protein
MSSTSAELRRPKGSDASVAARVAIDQKGTRLPMRSGRLANEAGGLAAGTSPLEPSAMPAAIPGPPDEGHPVANRAMQPTDRRLPHGAGSAPAAAVPEATVPGRRTTGVGRILLSLALLFLLPVVLAATAGYFAATYLEEVRAGRSEIMFHLPDLAGDAAGRFLATQPVVVRSYPVVEPVARAEAMPVNDILGNLDVTMVQSSALMRIEYQDTDSERILRVLEAVTVGYLGLLRDIAMIEGASHRILSAPYLLEEPVGPKPIQAAAIAAVVGLAVAFAGLVILAQLRRPA